MVLFSPNVQLLERVEHLMVVVAQTLTGDISVRDALVQHTPEKYEVEREIGECSRTGAALLERLALPVIVIDGCVFQPYLTGKSIEMP